MSEKPEREQVTARLPRHQVEQLDAYIAARPWLGKEARSVVVGEAIDLLLKKPENAAALRAAMEAKPHE